MKGNVKNIIFDMGNVLFSIDYKKTHDAFEALGYDNFAEMYSQFNADALFEKLETGKISNADFYKKMIESHSGTVNEMQIDEAWNGMLLHWRTESLHFLEKLSKKYTIYLLSNTNDIHLQAVIKLLKEQTGRESIDELFTVAYYSHKINYRKPNADIFDFVLKDANIKAAETLFIDDLENNIETAAALGFKTHLLLPEETIEELDYEKF
ncbi:MAG: HAD family phosphatase [Ferruginibacter sp.]|nr:HAD family phosphatase [Ferruginibacter sp.]